MTEEVEITDVKPPTASLQDLENEDDIEDEETKKKRERERSFWTKLWQGLALASFAINITAMAFFQSGVTIAMGVIACIVAPIVFKRQCDLQDTDSLRRVQNLLRHDVNKLQTENSKLHTSIDELETQVNELQETEAKLNDIAGEQQVNVDALVAAVKENQIILDEMKTIVKGDTLQDIMAIVLQSDLDQTCSICEQEIQILKLRLEVDPRVNVNADNLNKAMEAHGGTIAVSVLVRDFYVDDIPDEERIFTLVEEELFKSSGA